MPHIPDYLIAIKRISDEIYARKFFVQRGDSEKYLDSYIRLLRDPQQRAKMDLKSTLELMEVLKEKQFFSDDKREQEKLNKFCDEIKLHLAELRPQEQTSEQKKWKKPKPQAPQGEWSKPMTKSRMRKALNIDSEQTFNTFAKRYGIRQAGNRQTWQIRLDTLDGKTRSKLEKV